MDERAHHRADRARRRTLQGARPRSWVPTTTSPSRSGWPNWSPASGPRSGARRTRPTDVATVETDRTSPRSRRASRVRQIRRTGRMRRDARSGSRPPSGRSSPIWSATLTSSSPTASSSPPSGDRTTSRTRTCSVCTWATSAASSKPTHPTGVLRHRRGSGVPLPARTRDPLIPTAICQSSRSPWRRRTHLSSEPNSTASTTMPTTRITIIIAISPAASARLRYCWSRKPTDGAEDHDQLAGHQAPPGERPALLEAADERSASTRGAPRGGSAASRLRPSSCRRAAASVARGRRR